MTLAEVAAAVGGRLAGAAEAGTVVAGPVVVDSRQVVLGALFVALPGERADGHDYAAEAVAAGAVAVLSAREVRGPAVVVDDPLQAIGALARASVQRIPGLWVVGVTGSSGKTSTKDLLNAVLSAKGPTVAPRGSYNNEIGLPLSALRADAGTRFLVAEMGARRRGNITYLCGITPPHVAVVLNVGSAHVGEFGSRENIALAKAELVEALPADGVAVLTADDDLVRAMAGRTPARVVLVGRSPDAQVRAEEIRLDPLARARYRLVTPAGCADVALAVHGEHQVANSLSAAAVGLEAGLTPQEVADALGAAPAASRWRMEVVQRADGVTVVNDAYNANPESMRAALSALVTLAAGGDAGSAGGTSRRTWAVLGEMLELGDVGEAEHDAVGRLAVRLGVARVVAVGEGARPVARGAAREGAAAEDALCVADPDAALALLRRQVAPGDVVLVKASRSIGLDVLAQQLLEDVPAGRTGEPAGSRT